MKKKKKSSIEKQILSAYHRDSRNREIELFGKTISYSNIYRNKKAYSRKVKHKLLNDV